MNPLRRLAALGQSVWLDDIRRDRIDEIPRWIEEDGLSGMTTNPTIFAAALSTCDLYDEAIRSAEAADDAAVFEALAVADVRAAAARFRGVWERTKSADGYVSIEVSPRLARDAAETIAEARRLYDAVGEPNVMIKVPGTAEGLAAIEELLAEGVPVNVTLLFSVERYREVMEAWLRGAKRRRAKGGEAPASVASFFVSRFDTLLDPELEARGARDLLHTTAIDNARLAYQAHKEFLARDDVRDLVAKGVTVQRPLWASTSTKDPRLPDTYYVDALVAPGTVTTLPLATYNAFRDHGRPAVRIEDDLEGARARKRRLAELGLDLEDAARRLEEEGIAKFAKSYDEAVNVSEKTAQAPPRPGP